MCVCVCVRVWRRRRDTVVILRDVLWLADRSDLLSLNQRLKHRNESTILHNPGNCWRVVEVHAQVWLCRFCVLKTEMKFSSVLHDEMERRDEGCVCVLSICNYLDVIHHILNSGEWHLLFGCVWQISLKKGVACNIFYYLLRYNFASFTGSVISNISLQFFWNDLHSNMGGTVEQWYA